MNKTLCFTDIQSPDAEYVDLLLNPERYTGYKGPDAWKIWNVIYEENCFKYVSFSFKNSCKTGFLFINKQNHNDLKFIFFEKT